MDKTNDRIFPQQQQQSINQITTNVNQRLQNDRRQQQFCSQIEDAKSRQYEQNNMKTIIHGSSGSEQPHMKGPYNRNQSLAFGSTQSRNIDLTRPLVTPTQRPKSEIFTGPLPYELNNNINKRANDVVDCGPVYAKDDMMNYRNQQQHALQSQNVPPPQQMVQEQAMMAKKQSPLQAPMFNFGGTSSFLSRAARRHDPELIPAKERYLFRDYQPSTSTMWGYGGIKKENSIMTCSMTSTKSFQTKHGHHIGSNYNSNNVGRGPKKSYSMNRLDQLAQPKKRVQPRVTSVSNSMSRITTSTKPITTQSSIRSTSTVTSSTNRPVPPPKTFQQQNSNISQSSSTSSIKNSNNSKSLAAMQRTPSTTSNPTTPTGTGSMGKKQRPLSHFEPLDSNSPVFESPLSDHDKKNEQQDDDKLDEYKRKIAEKRAEFRKKQEQKLKQLTKGNKKNSTNNDDEDDDNENDGDNDNSDDDDDDNKIKKVPVVRRPRSTVAATQATTIAPTTTTTKSLAEETQEALEKEQIKDVIETSVVKTEIAAIPENVVAVKNEQQVTDSVSSPQTNDKLSVDSSSTTAISQPSNQLIDFDAAADDNNENNSDSSNNNKQQKININNNNNDNIININKQQEELIKQQIKNLSLNSTCDSSEKTAEQTAKEIEINRQYELERQKRKSRIQEILKGRIRKDDNNSNNNVNNLSSADENSLESNDNNNSNSNNIDKSKLNRIQELLNGRKVDNKNSTATTNNQSIDDNNSNNNVNNLSSADENSLESNDNNSNPNNNDNKQQQISNGHLKSNGVHPEQSIQSP